MSPALLFALVLSARPVAALDRADDLDSVFAGYESCFALLDAQSGAVRAHGATCERRGTPASTFKVAHAVLALETGVAPDESFALSWDGTARPIRSWNRDHDLRSAVRDSVLWYFQETARRIGPERMAAGVAALGYGNADTSSGPTTFWLGGSLQVSPLEQVEFLDGLRLGRLPVSSRSQRIVRELLVVDERGGAVLRGKSGTHLAPDVGWFVGWVERGEQAWVFATRIEGDGARGYSAARRMSEDALSRLGLWPS